MATALLAILLASTATARQPVDLTQLSLEQLLNVDVTTVFKKPSPLFGTPAAVHVITNEDIRRSGVTSIPEALRLVPGLHVARIDANKWAISSRGFNDRFAEKLLVLIDGRSVYTPMFNGVYWDAQDTLLEDIDRIEVILGPGGATWGANAVNGVINIITRSAHETRGGYVEAGIGSEDKAFAAVRYGERIGEVDVRAYAKAKRIDDLELGTGLDAQDDWSAAQVGFRADWDGGPTRVTVQGDYFDLDEAASGNVPSFTAPFLRPITTEHSASGGNALLRVEHDRGESHELSIQGYFDFSDRRDPFNIALDRQTFDLELEHRFLLGHRQQINYGLGLRHIRYSANATEALVTAPRDDHLNLFSAFIQDEIRLLDDRLRVTLGSKFEHNSVTGLEIMPSARVAWRPTDRHTIWAAASRAVRVPGISEFDSERVVFPIVSFETIAPGVTLPAFVEGSSIDADTAEKLIALEAGFRAQLGESLSVDVAGFYFDYTDLINGVMGTPRFLGCSAADTPFVSCLPTGIVVPITGDAAAQSSTDAQSYGFELGVRWQATATIRLSGWYAIQKDNVQAPPGTLPRAREDTSPRHQALLRASFDLLDRLELDVWGRYADRLRAPGVAGYATASARLAWRPVTGLELSLVGHDLLQSRHAESAGNIFIGGDPSEVERSVYLKGSYRF